MLAVNGGRVDGIGARVVGCSAVDAGGGIAVEGAGSVAELVASIVEENSAGTSGGGVAVLSGARLVVDGCVLKGNTAETSGGGVAVLSGARLVVDGCGFEGNVAGETGGGVWVDTSAAVEQSTMSATVMSGNVAVVGGGLSVAPQTIAVAAAAAVSAATVPASGDDAGGEGFRVALDLIGVRMVGNVGSKWGGGLFACDARVNVTGVETQVGGNVAGRSPVVGSSGDVFVCAAGSAFVPSLGGEGLPWIDVGGEVGGVDGWRVGGPLTGLEWVVEPEGRVEAGGGVAGVVRGVDWFGQEVVYGGVVFETTVDDARVLAAVDLPPTLLSSLEVDTPVADCRCCVGTGCSCTPGWG